MNMDFLSDCSEFGYNLLMSAICVVFLGTVFYIIPKYYNKKLSAQATVGKINAQRYSISFRRFFTKISTIDDSLLIIKSASAILLCYYFFTASIERVHFLLFAFYHCFLVFILWRYKSRIAALLLLPSSFVIFFYWIEHISDVNHHYIRVFFDVFLFWIKIRTIEASFKIHGFPLKILGSNKLFFKIYFLFALFLFGFGSLKHGFPRIWEIIDICLYIVAAVGLFGFAWARQIGTPNFWKFFFALWVIWIPIYYFGIPWPAAMLKVGTKTLSQWLLGGESILFLVPHFYALYRYTRSNATLKTGDIAQQKNATFEFHRKAR